MKKVILSFLLVFTLAFTIFGQTPNSPDDFEIDNSSYGGVRLTRYKGTRGDVVIPATIDGMNVTEIGANCFNIGIVTERTGANSYTLYSSVMINSVVFPNTIIAIGSGAFSGQPLTSISLPSSLRIIGERAFFRTQFPSVVIPNGVTYVGRMAFGRWTSDSVEVLDYKAPNYTRYERGGDVPLTSIVIPPSLANYSAGSQGFREAFQEDRDINIDGAFPNISVTRITLPANVHDRNLVSISNYSNDILRGNFWSFFPNSLYRAYVGNGKKAGTYVWTGRIWVVE